MDLRTVLQASVISRLIRRVREWGSHGRIVELVDSTRAIRFLLVAFLTVSMIRLLLFDWHASLKFLSFALVFVVTAALVWPIVQPLED